MGGSSSWRYSQFLQTICCRADYKTSQFSCPIDLDCIIHDFDSMALLSLYIASSNYLQVDHICTINNKILIVLCQCVSMCNIFSCCFRRCFVIAQHILIIVGLLRFTLFFNVTAVQILLLQGQFSSAFFREILLKVTMHFVFKSHYAVVRSPQGGQ